MIHKKLKSNGVTNGVDSPQASNIAPVIGNLLGSHETHKRITCLEAFMLDGTAPAAPQANDSAVSGMDENDDDDADGFDGFEDDDEGERDSVHV